MGTTSDDASVLDVLIVGAGLSGIGAAAMLGRRCKDKRYTVLEARSAIGGTWDLFRYPGIRSDSDMYTLGYGFRPWTGLQAIADGPAIRAYVAGTAREYGVEPHIRFGHKVVKASWSSEQALWTVTAALAGGGEAVLRARFLHLCSGYYNYDEAYRPRFEGEDGFRGRIVHPQFWPEDLDYGGKRVVVVGSGATAVTLVPAMAARAAHVTMLPRSPSYVVARPAQDRFAQRMQRWLPARLAYALTRWRLIAESIFLYRLARGKPALVRRHLLARAQRATGPGVDAQTHFSPSYQPWDQRVCLAPDGDLFRVLREGGASIVTDHIVRFTRQGILLASGRELQADLVVLATGLSLRLLGGAAIEVDGRLLDPGQAMAYKGMMLGDVPEAGPLAEPFLEHKLAAYVAEALRARRIKVLESPNDPAPSIFGLGTLYVSLSYTRIPAGTARPERYRGYSLYVSQRDQAFERSLACSWQVAHALSQTGEKPWSNRTSNAATLLDPAGVRGDDALTAPTFVIGPSVLLEAGVMVNDEEVARLSDPVTLKKMAGAIAEGINNCAL